ncbi:non-specific serine/threonine protein kinase [Ranunculus cassubicifolius]
MQNTPSSLLQGWSLCFVLYFPLFSISQKTCPYCGSMEVPYPLSTSSKCGDPDYSLRCDARTRKLYLGALNGSSYLVQSIQASTQKMVVQPPAWVPGKCITRDMLVSEGLRLNQTLPFNVTSSNTIFLLNCSPRLLVSPLNCTVSSLCHRYLEQSGRVDQNRSLQCSRGENPCCTFVAGGMPSAYKIRLHSSGCQAFRSIVHLDSDKPANEWEEGLEIQWSPPPEPICKAQFDCSGASTCLATSDPHLSRCLCIRGYYWDHSAGICSKKANSSSNTKLSIKVGLAVFAFFIIAVIVAVIKIRKFPGQSKLSKEREDMMKANNGGKSARLFGLKEVKKATSGFSKDRILGAGGFGEVYKGILNDGTIVAIKSAKVGNIKSTQQVLNEVGILSQVNHKHLVRLFGCCMEAEQPLMIYEYIPNGTLHEHLNGKIGTFLDWKTRLNIALQTAEALAYLHSSAYTPIYHRDVKSTNILLDNELNAKVADFGLSRLARPGLSHVSTCAQGTLGYLDPEYYRNYQLTDKSDVYSFGVVLLELLTSQNAIDFSRDENDVNLAVYASRCVSDGTVMGIVDRQLLDDGDDPKVASIKMFTELAMSCLGEKKKDRPCMKDVVEKLESIIGSM